MKRIIMVAARDLKESMATKGFWIGILMLPITFMVIGVVSNWISRQQPVTTFIVMDRAGGYVERIDKGLERRYTRNEMAQLQTYLDENLAQPGESIAPMLPREDPGQRGSAGSQISDTDVDAYLAGGGAAAVLRTAKPYLRTDARPFMAPRRLFERLAAGQHIGESHSLHEVGLTHDPAHRILVQEAN